MTKLIQLSEAAIIALRGAKEVEEEGTHVFLFPEGTTVNTVREIQDLFKVMSKPKKAILNKFHKILEINKFTDRNTRQRGVVIAISQLVPDHKTKEKLVPKDGPLAPDYRGDATIGALARAHNSGIDTDERNNKPFNEWLPN
jgi:hypothetical protein